MKKIFVIILAIISIILILFSSSKKEDFIIVSYGNQNSEALVKKIYNLSKDEISNKYSEYNFLKIDNILYMKKISYKELNDIITKTNKNGFKYGVSFDDNFNNFLLSEEINSNNVIDYNKGYLELSNINKILISKGKLLARLPKYLYIFETESKYYDNGFIELHNIDGYNIRNTSLDIIPKIINSASITLEKMVKANGKYIYGYTANEGTELLDYNILRHAGSTWSLILNYKMNPSEKLSDSIKKSIEYIIENNLIYKNNNRAYVFEEDSSEIKLGGNALTLLMLSEYMSTFNNYEYLDIAKQIANGIISFQNDDGSFIHVLKKNLAIKDEYRTVYYDGEATYSLLKLYGITKEISYINSVEKSFEYFVDNNYENYHDHWLAHSLDEYSKYRVNKEIVSFALLNYTFNSDYVTSLNLFNPTGLELLTSTYSLYNRLSQTNRDLFNDFDVSKLISDIENRTQYLLGRYTYPEVVMYFENPELALNAFYSKEDDFRLRIDDLQHSIVGLLSYYELFQKNNK